MKKIIIKIIREIISLIEQILVFVFFVICTSLMSLAIYFVLGKISLHYNYKIINSLLASNKAIPSIAVLLTILSFVILAKILEKIVEKLEKYDEYDE